MKNFYTEFISYNETHNEGKRNILIPALQRDYVQGGRDYIIKPFLDQLLAALKDERKVDLNYLYGAMEKGKGFVPIDGQQRLITLWLLNLYIYTKIGKNYPVELKFASREFANEFSSKLKANLKFYIKSKDLKNEIIDSPWFISGWQYDITVANMLKTLDYISQKEIDDFSNYNKYENITFSFLDMDEKGLTDDIYVKMNGRGRPLSYFENLKSWMDEQVSNKSEAADKNEENWQIKMDNKWTDFFWKNRNQNQEHPEEIDDEQQRLFYTLILLYWTQQENNFSKKIEERFKDKSVDKDSLMKYCNLDEKIFSFDKVQETVFKSLRESKQLIPLYWIEKLNLFEDGTFKFIEDALDCLYEIDTNNLLNSELNLFLNERKKDEKRSVSYMYQIAMESATYEKTIPYLFVLINTPKKYIEIGNTSFEQWIRMFRNLIENTTITKDNISKICACIRDITEIAEKSDKDFYNAIVDTKTRYDTLEGFSKSQLSEEYQKAVKIIENQEWENEIKDAEEYKLLKGKIWVLFQNKESTTIETFNKRYNLLKNLYEKSLAPNEDSYHFVKVLLSYMEKDKKDFPNMHLKSEGDNWKKLITDEKLLFDAFQKTPDTGDKKTNIDSWLSKLVNTKLLNNSREDGKVLVCFQKKLFVLWGTAGLGNSYGCVVLNYKRDEILHQLETKGLITVENKPVDETTIWPEWYRTFRINETSISYQWAFDNCIYKLKDKNRIERENIDNNSGDSEKYVCIKCEGQLNTENFIKELNNL